MASPLTFKQSAVLSYIIRTQRGQGYSPSVREIGAVLGLQSPSTVHQHLRALEQKGWIRRRANRTIEVLRALPLDGA